MASKQLSLDDLVSGLERFGNRYEALDVFTRDIENVARDIEARRVSDLQPVHGEPFAFMFERNGHRYKLRFHKSGIARLTRAKDETLGLSENQLALGALGAAVGVLSKSLPSAVLGFLVGATLGGAANSPKRVFTMTYDPPSHGWVAYDGPLAQLLREARREVDAALASERS